MYIIKQDPNYTDQQPYINVDVEYFHIGDVNFSINSIRQSVESIGEWPSWSILSNAYFFKTAHEAIAIAKKLNRPNTVYIYNKTTKIAEIV